MHGGRHLLDKWSEVAEINTIKVCEEETEERTRRSREAGSGSKVEKWAKEGPRTGQDRKGKERKGKEQDIRKSKK